jgi:hypothetical protein
LAVQETGLNPGYYTEGLRPPTKIIHVKNWHWVPKRDFAIGLQQSNPYLTGEELERRYATFLDDVEELQREQVILIRELAMQHVLRSAFYEGVTPDNMPSFELAERRATRLHKLEGQLKDLGDDPEVNRVRRELMQLIQELRHEVLQLGAIGTLIREGSLESVIPLESTATIEAANPITADGHMRANPAAMKAREDEMVRRILVGGPIAIVVLGGDHDLTEALKTTGRPFTYEFVEAPTYKRLAKETP